VSIDLKKMAEDVFADVVYPSKGTEETFCDQHNRDLFLVLARKVAEAVKREDAATAEPIDDVLAGMFRKDADAIERGDEKDYADRDAERARAEREL
jgi:hypothetical protein